jgi:hypothetical protein
MCTKKIYLKPQKSKINYEKKYTETNAPLHALMAQAYGHGINMSQELESSMQYLKKFIF